MNARQSFRQRATPRVFNVKGGQRTFQYIVEVQEVLFVLEEGCIGVIFIGFPPPCLFLLGRDDLQRVVYERVEVFHFLAVHARRTLNEKRSCRGRVQIIQLGRGNDNSTREECRR